MSEMRKEFRPWFSGKWYGLTTPGGNLAQEAFEAGYQAAIAAVKEGGAQAFIEHHKGGDNLNWDQLNKQDTPLYKLPEGI